MVHKVITENGIQTNLAKLYVREFDPIIKLSEKVANNVMNKKQYQQMVSQSEKKGEKPGHSS